MATKEEAAKAIEMLNGRLFRDRNLVVDEARPQPQRRGGGGGGPAVVAAAGAARAVVAGAAGAGSRPLGQGDGPGDAILRGFFSV